MGPKIQEDIFSIFTRFRVHAVVVTDHVEKIYRQALMAPKNRDYQRILERFNKSDPICDYRLKTVTYGLPRRFLGPD